MAHQRGRRLDGICTPQDIRARCVIDPSDPDACWVFRTPAGSTQTARVWLYGGRVTTAARAMIELTHDWPLPPELIAHHRCGNVRCVRPEHLSVRTRAQSIKAHQRAGRYQVPSKRRAARAVASQRRRITPEALRTLLTSPEPATVLAARLGITVRMAREYRKRARQTALRGWVFGGA